MESNVKYMTAEEIRGLPTSEIASMTMLSGDVILIGPNSQQDLSKSRQIFTKCDNKCIPSIQGSDQNVILRTKKVTTVKEEDGVEKVQETVEIDVEPQPEGEDKKAEPLRGPDGKLLNDILTGQEFGEQEQEQQPPLEPQPQVNEEENQQNNYPNPQEEQGQYYVPEYDPNQVPQTNEEQQQYAPEENNMGYEGQEQYYPPEDQYYDPEQYPGQDMNQQVPEQYVGPNGENEYYPQEYMPDPNNPDQNNMYPAFEDENNQQYPPEEYQQPMNVPEQQGYVPEVEPMVQPPFQEPIQPTEQPPVQPENYPSEAQPMVQPEVQPPVQQPIQPEIQPPAEQTVQPVVQPVQQPIQPPVQPPIQPPVQQPIQPPSQKPIQPPARPQIPKQVFPGQRPGIKIVPQPSNKRSVVQIKFGFDPRMPQRPGMRPMGPMGPMGLMGKFFPQPPHGPQAKRQVIGIGFVPARPQPKQVARVQIGGKKKNIINPINPLKIIDFVHDVMAPMAVRRVGLRSTNPNAVVKTAQKEDVKEGAQQGTALRARRKEYAPQEEVLCPECACEECYGNQNQYATQYGYNNQYGQNFYTTKVFRGKGHQYGPCKNFNYHEIVETSDNSKTHVVVKKGGITIKPTQ